MTTHPAWREKYGPWALVTGAASGLGREFAMQLAASHLDIIAVDIQEELLNEHVAFLQQTYGVMTVPAVVDLASDGFLEQIKAVVGEREVGFLANVAGISSVCEFLDTPLVRLQKQVSVNCMAPMMLSYYFGQQMRQRGRGGILFISSASAYQGTALVAHYAATKAYNLILAEGLWDELRSAGVDVEAGPTVVEALAALGKTPSRIAGSGNRRAALLTGRFMSRKQAILLFGRSMRKVYASLLPSGKTPVDQGSEKHT
jgi:short-subunit dehydrogenase